MVSYRSVFREEAKADLRKLDHSALRRVINKIEWLTENISTITPASLGYDLHDLYKVRVGQWRVVYAIDHSKREVAIFYVDLRERIYKRLRRQ